ncbi:hypothetical protein [Pseudomonas sp. nanlin1]|uniref:hypothetical protein n=1 Tax=Pseudomonas sp. nanlin1 TaxID=3040605 RepID=UPI00388FB5D8
MLTTPMNQTSSRIGATEQPLQLQSLTSTMNPSQGSERPQTMDQALDALVKSMTNDQGQVNSENPLVKMLGEFLEKMLASMLQQSGAGGDAQAATQGSGAATVQDMSPEELKNALSGMLEQLMGGNAPSGNGFGESGQGGGQDMLSQLLGALTQDKLNGLLQPNEQLGGADFDTADKDLMQQVAQFMDQHPEEFGSPDNADGSTRSWTDEVNERTSSGPEGKADTYLDAGEAEAFAKAIEMLGQSAASGSAQPSGTLANSTTPIAADEAGGNGGGGFGAGSGALGDSNVSITLTAEQFLSLVQGSQGGSSAQSQALNQDATQAAGSIMDKMFG